MHFSRAIIHWLLFSALTALLATGVQAQAVPNCTQDRLAPACFVSVDARPQSITVHTFDVSGICEIVPTRTENTILVPNVFFGQIGTAPTDVNVVAVKIDVTKPARFELRVTDCCGRVRLCDPILTSVLRAEGRPIVDTFIEIPQEEGFVRITNGNPGLRKVTLIVNGRRFQAPGLADGEEITLDVSSVMLAGDQNVISLVGYGKPGGSAAVMIWDGSD
jgi:hypothetical protein